jgi:arylformamidase
VLLVGIDTPSGDPVDASDMPCHRRLRERGMTWIEGLTLEVAPPGLYRLLALPLPLVGVEAAPLRAVLELSRGGAR